MTVYQRADGKWRCQIRRKNYPFDENFDTEAEAREAQAVADGKPGGMSFRQYVGLHYKKGNKYLNLAPVSRDSYDDRLTNIVRLVGSHALASISSGTLENFISARRAEVMSETGVALPGPNSTIQLEINVLSSVLSSAVLTKHLPVNPLLPHIKAARGRRIKRPGRTSPADKARLFEVAYGLFKGELAPYKNGRARALGPLDIEAARFFHIITVTGIRVKELSRLTAADINLADGLYRSTLKGGKTVWRVLPRELYPLIAAQVAVARAQVPRSKFLFSTAGGPYRARNAAVRLQKVGLVAPGWRPHMSRHDFIANALSNGVAPQDIIAATGHSDIRGLLWYVEPGVESEAARDRLRAIYSQRSRDIRAQSELSALTPALPADELDAWGALFLMPAAPL